MPEKRRWYYTIKDLRHDLMLALLTVIALTVWALVFLKFH